ncbi:MAG: ATP-dependent DNA helicase RecG [Oscillospiraceae bacterium]|nr:ATP-dependent DNA helicase RecG [Oscillospiraceae bacterium]
MNDILQQDIRYLKGVGEKRAVQLNRLGVFTVNDLLYLLPRRYIDYSDPYPLAYAPFDEACAVKAVVLQSKGGVRIRGGRTMFKVLCADDTARLEITFFNSEYTVKQLEVGQEYIFYGKVGGSMLNRQMTTPVFIPADSPLTRRAVYPLTAGLSAKMVSNMMAAAFERIDTIPDFMPRDILAENNLPDLYTALKNIHFPKNNEDLQQATGRLAFDELFSLQLGLNLLNGQQRRKTNVKVKSVNIDDFLHSLPYTPTGAQMRAIRDILLDFKGETCANRLVQGDVGSGKTLVAISAMYCMHKNGYQSCMMAPTEILANQHYANVKKMLEPFGVKVGLLTAGLKPKERREVLAQLESGEINILIGTHSVLSDKVQFKNMALFITDEQHRFGVNQRNIANAKGENPHILVMSATPIPRTLAMIIYAGMQISVIDEMPKGRKPVQTLLVGTDLRRRMFGFIDRHIKEGYQCYIVLPAIEENETMTDLQSVEKYCNEVVRPLLPQARVGMLHGKMKNREKDRIMTAFSNGEIDILCSTTVVEVGVDVPNAALMIIENAERYGLSALHQLRGRVGRGTVQSWCILVSDKKTPQVQERLKFMAANASGFAVSQYDLEHRGPGDFFGSRQHGLPLMKTAGLCSDLSLTQAAREAAIKILTDSPDLSEYPLIKQRTAKMFESLTL